MDNFLLRKYLLNISFKDFENNVLIFCDKDIFDKDNIINENKLFLSVDGSDCSEGIFEKVELNINSIKDVLLWYGYNELYDIFEKWYKEVIILWELVPVMMYIN